ncbi:MAG: hypothetical protein RIQ47_1068 [Bacteroidota bacterium]|jgi:hypothetical protein
MKRILHVLFYCLLLVSLLSVKSAIAQNGLENIIVEKYYVSNAADSAAAAGVLPVGSVTYRIYVDMKPGYNFQALYGVAAHPLTIQSTAPFFNDENYGSTSPNGISTTNIRKFTAMIDSWFSVGAGCAGKVGSRKTVDSDGSLGNANGILANNDPTITFPITGTNSRDGLLTGSPVAVTFVGLNNTGNGDLGVFDGTSQVGTLFTTNNGSIAALGGATGLDTTNIVCVGQFTTTGVLSYVLNVQIGTPTGGTENYVSSNPTGSEITRTFLTGTVGAANQAPTVSITAPANGASFITGSSISITATAADADGSVSSVEFFVDGVSIGVDNAAPYAATYTGVAGTRVITARATDDQGTQTTSSAVTITVANNPPPTCSITAPANGASFVVGDAVSITATATDNGSVTQVEFFVDGVSLSVDNTSPYAATYTATLGSHTITARATDNLGAQTTSTAVTISVVNNVPPTVSVTAPANGANFTFPATVTITASASDPDGSVSSVGFFVNGSLVGTDNTAPYSFAWTSVIGTASITARATDNRGAVTTSAAVSVSILDPNALPYKVATLSARCVDTSVCLPIRAVDTIANVIGYDMTLQYNQSKLRATGNITVLSDLINPAYVDVANSIDSVNGQINISLFFNSTAPANAAFAGFGNLICVEFVKKSAFSNIDTAAVSIPFLQESYFNGVSSRLVEAGKYLSFKDSLFQGSLKFWLDNSAIKYNAANPNQFLVTNIKGVNDSCTSYSSVATQPDTNGVFSYVLNNLRKINIEKNILGTVSVQPVINGFDAFLIRRTILSDPTFIPNVYQAIAMDVNRDGVISAGDLSQVNQRAVLLVPEFRQAWNYNASGVSNGSPSKDWVFVDSSTTLRNDLAYRISTTFPGDDGVGFSKSRVPVTSFCLTANVSANTACPEFFGDVFRGILVGDVNGSYSATNPNSNFRLSGNESVVLDGASSNQNGQFIDVPVYFTSTEDVHALDFALKFNENALRFVGVTTSDNTTEGLAHFNEDDRTVRYTSFNLNSMNAMVKIATARFEVLNGSYSSNDIEITEAYLNGDAVRFSNSSLAESVNLMVYPNPTNADLNIVSTQDVQVEIYDVNGSLVFSRPQLMAGDRLVVATGSFASGVYTLRAVNSNFVSTQKIVVNK